MENHEKEILNRYKLWRELLKEISNDSKDINENCLLSKDFDSLHSAGCKGCGCYADVKIRC